MHGCETTVTVSVIIPAYNAEAFIARAVKSVLAQTRPADEIIVVDDGSTDRTAQIVRGIGGAVRLIEQANAGVSAARNAGIDAAGGEWIAFLDADDEWLPDKIERQLALLQRYPELAWVSGNYRECLCSENRTADCVPADTCRAYLGGKDYFDSYFNAVRRHLLGHTDCMLIRRRVFDEVGRFSTDLPIAEDLDMWMRIAYRYPQVGFLCEPLAVYHLTVGNSLMVTKRPRTLYADFMRRHFDLAQEAGCMATFLPAAGAIMRRWIRAMLFGSRKQEIRELLTGFPVAFGPGYRRCVYVLTAFPQLTEGVLRLGSKGIRALKLRRKLTRPPAPSR